MKTLAILLLASNVLACPKGTVEYKNACYPDPRPSEIVAVQEVQPSNEKPSKHPEPAWQRGEVIADMPQSLQARDAALDKEKQCASIAGNIAAKIPLTEEEKIVQASVCK